LKEFVQKCDQKQEEKVEQKLKSETFQEFVPQNENMKNAYNVLRNQKIMDEVDMNHNQ